MSANTVPTVAKRPTMTCSDVMRTYHKSHVYVTRMAGEGKLIGHKEPMPGRKTEQWMFFTSDVITWRKTCEQNKQGRPHFEFSGASEHEQELQDMLAQAKPSDIAALRKSLEKLTAKS